MNSRGVSQQGAAIMSVVTPLREIKTQTHDQMSTGMKSIASENICEEKKKNWQKIVARRLFYLAISCFVWLGHSSRSKRFSNSIVSLFLQRLVNNKIIPKRPPYGSVNTSKQRNKRKWDYLKVKYLRVILMSQNG